MTTAQDILIAMQAKDAAMQTDQLRTDIQFDGAIDEQSFQFRPMA